MHLKRKVFTDVTLLNFITHDMWNLLNKNNTTIVLMWISIYTYFVSICQRIYYVLIKKILILTFIWNEYRIS